MSDSEQEQVPELSHQELLKLVLDQRKQMEADRKEFADFRRFVGSRMVPLEDKTIYFLIMSDQEEVPELSHLELYKLVLDQRRELEQFRNEFVYFKHFSQTYDYSQPADHRRGRPEEGVRGREEGAL